MSSINSEQKSHIVIHNHHCEPLPSASMIILCQIHVMGSDFGKNLDGGTKILFEFIYKKPKLPK